MCSEKRPSAKAVLQNLKEKMPFRRKIWFIIKNTTRKIVRFQNCCGNPGEPGC